MEELIVKYLAKHSSVGLFDRIERQTTPKCEVLIDIIWSVNLTPIQIWVLVF